MSSLCEKSGGLTQAKLVTLLDMRLSLVYL